MNEPRRSDSSGAAADGGSTDLLRSSRDGDQFHYTWAARQSLRLLDLRTSLSCIYVEGASPSDASPRTGEETIDLSEYSGGDSLATADHVVYRQLKHSTVRVNQPFAASELSGTVRGFASWYLGRLDEDPDSVQRVSFSIVSNRRCGRNLIDAIRWLSEPSGREPNKSVKTLRDELPSRMTDEQVADFFARIEIDDTAPSLFKLRGIFEQDLGAMLAGFVGDFPILLKEEVASRATSSLRSRDPLTRASVLATLRETEESLFPAPNLIAAPPEAILTSQVRSIAKRIATSSQPTILLHASGGIGKSALVHSMGNQLPEGSLLITYDCFGNGAYRRPSGARHEYQQGVVQIVNELASHGLCNPLIPGEHTTATQYAGALVHRLGESTATLTAMHPEALLVVYIDAADNAVLAAQETNGTPFVAGLLREAIPEGVRLVLSCRSERRALLNAPRRTPEIEMRGFGKKDTKRHVLALLGASAIAGNPPDRPSAADLETFHHLTQGNPRLQVAALKGATTLADALASLSRLPGSTSDLLDDLLQRAVDDAAELTQQSPAEIQRICEALAALRPMIPVSVLSRVSDVDESAVRSFIADIGRGLMLDGESVQFIDEPTETWFQKNYRPRGAALASLIARLLALASEHPYIAGSIPVLLWEASRFDDLVTLALSDEGLPANTRPGSLVESREIAHQRTVFALKGALTLKRDFEASQLAVRLGYLSAGNQRQADLLRANPDLVGLLVDQSVQEQLIATRAFANTWPGSNLASEATLLSYMSNSKAPGRFRWQSAVTAAKNWAATVRGGSGHEPRAQKGLAIEDVSELVWAKGRLDGPSEAAGHLALWRPEAARFRIGLGVCRRMVDHGLWSELESFAVKRKGLKLLPVAAACASWEANRVMPESTTREAVGVVVKPGVELPATGPGEDPEDGPLGGVLWSVACALRYGLLTEPEAVEALRRYLPKDLGHYYGGWNERGLTVTLLFGFALLAHAEGRSFDPASVAGESARVDPANAHVRPRDLDTFEANVLPLAPLVGALVDLVVRGELPSEAEIETWSHLVSARGYDRDRTVFLAREGALVLARLLALRDVSDAPLRKFASCCSSETDDLPMRVKANIIRWFSRIPSLVDPAAMMAQVAGKRVVDSLDQSESKIESLVALTRAVLPIGSGEARGYFNDALSVSERIGEDGYNRWDLLCKVARRTSRERVSAWRRANAIATVSEHLEPLLLEGPSEFLTLQMLSVVSPASSICVASRWRDTRRVQMDSVARAFLVNGPDDQAVLLDHPRLALALLPFSQQLDVVGLAKRAVQTDPSRASQIVSAAAFACHDQIFDPDDLADLGDEIATLLAGTCFDPPPGRVDSLGAPTLGPIESSSASDWPDQGPHAFNVSEWLDSIDFETPQGWHSACDRKTAPTYVSSSDVAKHALSVSAAHQARVMQALAIYGPDLYLLSSVIDAANEFPLARGARAELAQMARQCFEGMARKILLARYQPIEIERLKQTSDPSADYVRLALDALGRDPNPYTAEEAFMLAGHVAERLDEPQCDALFEQCLGLFDDLNPAPASTSPVSSLLPPDSVDSCVAALIWGALGDASMKIRWRAAHSVVVLCLAGCEEALGALLELATGMTPSDFAHSPSLVFYRDHATQWLLLALARASHDVNGRRYVVPFVVYLKEKLWEVNPNIAFQMAARDALTELHRAGLVVLAEEESTELAKVGAPTRIYSADRFSQDLRTVASIEELGALAKRVASEQKGTKRRRRSTHGRMGGLILGDFIEFWCEPLGEAFGLDSQSVWNLTKEMRSVRNSPPRDIVDERRERHLYPDGNYLHKSSRPDQDDLEFYHDIHALYSVAALLLSRLPVIRDQDSEADSDQTLFDEFLVPHVPRPGDGRWLADRKDPVPPTATRHADRYPANVKRPAPPSSADGGRRRTWRNSVSRRDLNHQLAPSAGWLVVAETRHESGAGRRQTIHISSVLVPRSTGHALLRAMQTASRFMGFPSTDDWDSRHVPTRYRLSEWVLWPEGNGGSLDSYDPLAEGVEFPPYRPSAWVAEELGVEPDTDMRVWIDGSDRELFWSWDWAVEADSSLDNSNHGYRLAVAERQLSEILTKLDKCLMIAVNVDRTERVYERGSGEKEKYGKSAHRYYLFDIDGSRNTI